MSFEPRDYLRHILAEADYLSRQTVGLTADRFMADETLRRAFVRSLEIIGEASKKIPVNFRAQYPNVAWRAMAGVRDRLIHAISAWTINLSGMSSTTEFRNCGPRFQ